MLSHIGLESFISRDNAIYTRSLVADFSPYYETGIKLSHQFNPRISAQFLILNGWQIISESNSNKAIGTQVSVQATDNLSVTYNTFFGKEAGFRHFHDLIIKYSVTQNWSIGSQFDLGFQDSSPVGGSASWYGFTLISRHALSALDAISFRVEQYADSKNVLVSTPNNEPFRAWGGSAGYDRTLTSQLTWRNEVRTILTDRKTYLSRSGFKDNETLFVSSLGLTF